MDALKPATILRHLEHVIHHISLGIEKRIHKTEATEDTYSVVAVEKWIQRRIGKFDKWQSSSTRRIEKIDESVGTLETVVYVCIHM
jgi:hypothetical protein